MLGLCEFRLSCHSLKVEVGRYNDIPVHLRTCDKCDNGEVQNEKHVVFRCHACNDLRLEYAGLFDEVENGDLSTFCAQDPYQVSRFVSKCLGTFEIAERLPIINL